jgi:hypothetical protein
MRTLLVLVLLFGSIPALSAQQAPPLAAESGWVRILGTSAPAPIGTPGVPSDAETPSRAAELPLAVSLATSRQLDASRRKPSLLGGVVGFVVGGVAGGLVGCSTNRDDYGVFCAGQSDTKVVLGAAAGGVVGGALGALLFGRNR